MNPRLPILILAFAISLLFVSNGLALEKSAARAPDLDRASEWRSGTETCSIIYYNTCTGWIWIWSSWSPEDRVGVVFDTCCSDGDGGSLLKGWIFTQVGSPAGYGFTGSVDVWNAGADGCLVGEPIASMSLLPVTGWNGLPPGDEETWGAIVPSSFALTFTTGTGPANPLELVTDHPAAGPTGPQACGTCFTSSRANRTYYMGTAASPLCPASALNDGICDAQFLWDVRLDCVVSVDKKSWSQIKALYR